MAPVPAPKKFWIFDGTVEQYPSVLSTNSVHKGKSCVDCHGGDATKNTREAAHTGDFKAIPGSATCTPCHQGIVDQTAGSLHTTLAGFDASLAARGFGTVDGTAAQARFDAQCTKCHVATTGGQAACGFCHVSVPNTAGGGLLKGHAFQETPSTDSNCTACHGSRVKDEYYGSNNALMGRNKAAFDDGSPFKAAAFTLQPDVHKTNGMACADCHEKDEMHGAGAPTDDDRYAVTTSPACADCHGAGSADASDFAAVGLHTNKHLDTMDCYVCHAQPYKSCFGCHTDVTATGVPFYKNNSDDPTLAARKAAATDPNTVFPDALMTFRVGLNPKWTGESDTAHKKYATLRHVPVDADVFTYTGANVIEGLIPDMTASPTWRYATPHSIQRTTEITTSCSNCHGAAYTNFWLTDPVGDAEGWIGAPYLADETAANADITVPAPMAPNF
ncbi:MAG: cytochrome c3 family protein [Thermoleophilia bacterium]